MRVRDLSLDDFKAMDDGAFDRYSITLFDGNELLLFSNGDWSFDDSKGWLRYWRYGRCSVIKYDNIKSIRAEALI